MEEKVKVYCGECRFYCRSLHTGAKCSGILKDKFDRQLLGDPEVLNALNDCKGFKPKKRKVWWQRILMGS